ncbi:MAG: cellulose-binding domain-containing protein [Anaerolineae bacterium]|nr:cellulose-binding domain-containing protein [Anaerolineae bacterium]
MKMKNYIFRSCAIFIALGVIVGSLSMLPETKPTRAAFGDRITVSGRQFYAGGARIWINGANTPWNNWNDFGGSYNASWWDNHFQQLHANGVNATRVWITCSGEVGINIDSSGYVSGATQAHWNHLDSFFQIAQNRQVYIMATLMSFDHFQNTYSTYQRWRNWINSDSNIDSYINNYLIPFLNRYGNNPWLWSIDLMNEPDWVYENAECGQIPWDRLQVYFAKAAKAIHENSQVLVTVGMGMPKYQSGSCSGWQGNKIADSALRARVNDPDVYIDFYSSHYYNWQAQWWGIPFYQSPTNYYGADLGKAVLIGETPATGSTGHTLTEDYENAYLNGWQGVMAWKSTSDFDEIIAATNAFRNHHDELVFPGGTLPSPTPTLTSTPGPTATPFPGSTCAVDYVVQSDWGSGATIKVTIRNDSGLAINGWTLTWTFPGNQQITQVWNATYTQNGALVSAKNVSWNANIPANGGRVNFGFNLSYSGANQKPTDFALNGLPCRAFFAYLPVCYSAAASP